MTPKELYDWAVDNGCENYDIAICVYKDGQERIFPIDSEYKSIDGAHDRITFDI